MSQPKHLFVSCFNSPSELDNYDVDSYGQSTYSVHDGILDISINTNEIETWVYAITKQSFPGSGTRIKARMDAMTNIPKGLSPQPYVYVTMFSMIIATEGCPHTNAIPIVCTYDPFNTDAYITFGYFPPFLYASQLQVMTNDIENVQFIYTEGSWDGKETGYHTFEVALYDDRIELYIDGKLVKTNNGNPLAGRSVRVGFYFYPIDGVATDWKLVYINAFHHVDWLVIDPIDAPPGDPPDLQGICGGGVSSGVSGGIDTVASSVMDSLAGVLEDTTSFISRNVNTIAEVVFASGFTLMLYRNSRRITSSIMRLLRH